MTETAPKIPLDDISTVVWDADNTLWDWVGYAVHAYERMRDFIAEISGKSPEETTAMMRTFYGEKKTLENEGLVQWLNEHGLFDDCENFDETEVILRVREEFEAARSEGFHVYDGIIEVMIELRARGIRQVILTDAPWNQALSRLERAGLIPYIDKICGMPMAEIDVPDELRSKRDLSKYPQIQVVEKAKPDTELESVVEMVRERIANEVVIIGDNGPKDMGLGEKYGCHRIWAKYGTASDELSSRISAFAEPHTAARNMQRPETPELPESWNKDGKMFIANESTDISQIFGLAV